MKGRAGRQEWWFIFLAVVIAIPRVLGWINAVVLTGVSTVSASRLAVLAICHLIVLAFALNLQRGVSTRRARDFGGRVWPFWIYAAVVITIRGLDLASLVADLRVPAAWLAYTYYGAILFAGAVFGLRKGVAGANRWGPPPRPFFDFVVPRANNYKPPRG